MPKIFDMLCESIAFGFLVGPICYLIKCAITEGYLYHKYKSHYTFFLKAYHRKFKLYGAKVMRGMPIRIRTSNSSMRYIVGWVIGIDDDRMLFIYCKDGTVTTYPLEKIDVDDVSFVF